jgi:hypothetical protein
MKKYRRLFVVFAILLSGASILPAWAMPWPNFDWQRFADAYRDPTGTPVSIVTATALPVEALPDLTVQHMKIDTRSTGVSCLTTLEPLGVRVLIANVGDAAAGSFQVEVNGARQNVSGLSSGQSLWLWFEGYRNMQTNMAVVDIGDQVQESDERNNQSSQMLPVPTPMPTCTQSPTAIPKIRTPRPTAAID